MNTFKLRVLSANEVFFEGECQSLKVPYNDNGTQCFLAHHVNTVMPVYTGMLTIKDAEGNVTEAFTENGILEFLDNEAVLISVSVQRPEEIDMARAQQTKERAEEILRQKLSQREYNETKATLSRAMERIKVKNRHEI